MENKWQFLSTIQYAGQYFLIEMKPVQKPATGQYYIETRSTEVTIEEAKKQQDNNPVYFSKL